MIILSSVNSISILQRILRLKINYLN